VNSSLGMTWHGFLNMLYLINIAIQHNKITHWQTGAHAHDSHLICRNIQVWYCLLIQNTCHLANKHPVILVVQRHLLFCAHRPAVRKQLRTGWNSFRPEWLVPVKWINSSLLDVSGTKYYVTWRLTKHSGESPLRKYIKFKVRVTP
jgi:hypothetical protein